MMLETEQKRIKPQILLVDDEVAMVRSLELLLRPLGDIHKAYSVPEAEEALAKNAKIDCIVTDVSMPEASGLTLLEKVRRKSPDTPVVVMTAYSSVPQAVDAMHRGAFEYVVKPFENSELVDIVKRAISKKGIVQGETKKMPTGWICNSSAMVEFLEKAALSAQHDSPLLLLGEIGVGKSRAARWVHDNSLRSKKEFFSLDGRAHEEDSPLLSQSLSRVGTLFVAEVFSLSPRVQDKLMEYISEGKIRVIAASSSSPEFQSLPRYREDLFKALTAVALKVPNLASRLDDFEALVREILMTFAGKMKLKKLEIDSQGLMRLKSHLFSGNVKELERVLERAAIEAKAGIITEEAIHFQAPDLKQLMPFSVPVEDGWNRLEVLRQSLERELIFRALEKYPDHSNTQIAGILGTTRRILELRMQAYQIREGN